MKKLFTVFVSFFVFTSSLAQSYIQYSPSQNFFRNFQKTIDPQFVLDSLVKKTDKVQESKFLKTLQNDSDLLDSIVIVWSQSRRDVYTYKYNSEGFKIEEINYTIVNDSIKGRRKTLYSYDSFNNLMLEESQNNNGEIWENDYKYEWFYDNNNLIVTTQLLIWEDEWKILHQSITTYSSSNQILSHNSINDFGEERGITEYTYDSKDRLIDVQVQYWNNEILTYGKQLLTEYDKNGFTEINTEILFENGQWINNTRTAVYFDQNRLRDKQIEIWENNSWQNKTLINNTYDGWGRLLTSVEKDWDIWINNWLSSRRRSYEYNNSGEILVDLLELWFDKWKPWYRITREYNSDNFLTSELSENRYGGTEWTLSSKYVLEYNEFNSLTYRKIIDYYSDFTSEYYGKFDLNNNLTEREEIYYSADNIDYRYKEQMDYDSSNRNIKYKRYEWRDGSFYSANSNYYYYKDSEEIFRADLAKYTIFTLEQNYPNPFNPETTISFSNTKQSSIKIILYNSIGEKVKTLTDNLYPEGTHLLQLSNRGLASGIYFYRIEADKYIETKKMVILK